MEHPQTPALTPAMREALRVAAALVAPAPIPAALLGADATIAALVGGGWLARAGLGAVRLTPQGRAVLSAPTPDEEGRAIAALCAAASAVMNADDVEALALTTPHLLALADARRAARDRPALLLALTCALLLAVEGEDAEAGRHIARAEAIRAALGGQA
jgi:hypothetical protein